MAFFTDHVWGFARKGSLEEAFLTHAYEVYTTFGKMEFDFAYKNCDFAHTAT